MTDVSPLLRQGLAYDQAGRHGEAARVYEQALCLEPGNIDAMHLLGLALFDSGDAKRGREYMERAVSARPHNAIFCHHYATIASSFGELDVANRISAVPSR